MRIGIDIDGVLTDIEQWQLDYGSKFYFEKYGKEIVNNKGYETYDIFKLTQKCDDKFWKEYFIDNSINIEVRKFAAKVIKKLKGAGNKIFIITSRGSFLSHSTNVMLYEENEKVVKEWLKKNDILYDEIIFSFENKLDICIDNKIDIMIEDKVDNINKISTKIPVICFNAGYNECCSGKNIIRCFKWYDIYAKIKRLINN